MAYCLKISIGPIVPYIVGLKQYPCSFNKEWNINYIRL